MSQFLLDTHAAIWLVEGQSFSQAAKEAFAKATAHGEDVLVSPMSAWEIGMLSARGRLRMPLTPTVWFERLLRSPGIALADLPTRVFMASSFLPGSPPRDPADRILIATARDGDHVLVTRDKEVLAYAGQGHLKALAC
jgi:PIN domain nuclease of toxin-antitoxin system